MCKHCDEVLKSFLVDEPTAADKEEVFKIAVEMGEMHTQLLTRAMRVCSERLVEEGVRGEVLEEVVAGILAPSFAVAVFLAHEAGRLAGREEQEYSWPPAWEK
jgi:hypothetical protein